METSTQKPYQPATLPDLLGGKPYMLLNHSTLLYFHEQEQQYVIFKVDNQQRTYTAKDYLQLPENAPFELINNQLVFMPSPFNTHQRVAYKLTLKIGNYVEANNLGEVFFAPADVHFSDDDIFQPDIYFVSIARKAIITEKYTYGSPDLTIEILSESTKKTDYQDKMEAYGKYEVIEYWIVDISEKCIEVYWNIDKKMELQQKATVNDVILSKAIAGFRLIVGDVFES
jgi:Uma2 family endonuclease